MESRHTVARGLANAQGFAMIGRVGRPSVVGVPGMKAGLILSSTDAPTARTENRVGRGRGGGGK